MMIKGYHHIKGQIFFIIVKPCYLVPNIANCNTCLSMKSGILLFLSIDLIILVSYMSPQAGKVRASKPEDKFELVAV